MTWDMEDSYSYMGYEIAVKRGSYNSVRRATMHVVALRNVAGTTLATGSTTSANRQYTQAKARDMIANHEARIAAQEQESI